MAYTIPQIPTVITYPRNGDAMEVGNPSGSPTQVQSAQMDMGFVLTINLSVTGLTGGGANLDNVPTVGRKIPSGMAILSDTVGVTGIWKLLTSAQATGPGCVQPIDNAALRWIKYV